MRTDKQIHTDQSLDMLADRYIMSDNFEIYDINLAFVVIPMQIS